MPSVRSAATNAVHSDATSNLISDIGGKQGIMWQIEKVIDRLGEDPSEIHLWLPMDQEMHRTADGTMVESVAEGIKLGDTITLPTGETYYVVDIKRDLAKDQLYVVGLDGRWEMQGWPIIGSFWSGEAETIPTNLGVPNEIYYRQGYHAIFNVAGTPNCIWRKGVPVFCKPYLGHNINTVIGTASLRDENVASFWTVAAAAMYCSNHIDRYPGMADMGEFRNVIPNYTKYNYGLYTDNDDKIMKEIDIEGMNLPAALQSCLNQAGPYRLYFNNDDGGYLVAKKFENTTGAGSSLRYVKGIADADTAFNCDVPITGGEIAENIVNTYGACIVAGDRVVIERRLAMTDATDGSGTYTPISSTNKAQYPLVPAWSTERENEMLAYVTALLKSCCPRELEDGETTGGDGGEGDGGGGEGWE